MHPCSQLPPQDEGDNAPADAGAETRAETPVLATVAETEAPHTAADSSIIPHAAEEPRLPGLADHGVPSAPCVTPVTPLCPPELFSVLF